MFKTEPYKPKTQCLLCEPILQKIPAMKDTWENTLNSIKNDWFNIWFFYDILMWNCCYKYFNLFK